MEAMKYHLLPERRSMMQSPRTKPRKSTVGSLYAVGGMDATKGKYGGLFGYLMSMTVHGDYIILGIYVTILNFLLKTVKDKDGKN